MEKSNRRCGSEGMALLVATMFVALALMVLASLGLRVINASHQTDQYQLYTGTLNGVESAYAQSLRELETGNDGNIGLGAWTPPAGALTVVTPSFTADHATLAPLTLTTTPNVSYMAYAHRWDNDGIDNNGDGAIDGLAEEGYFTIYAYGRNRTLTRRTEVVVQGQNVNVWTNAIFAGNGQAGGLINGNVSIHGAVHLLGSNLPAAAVAIAALDLSGTSLIHNNYAGIPAALQARIPALPTRTLNGEVVATLNANLRVKRGLVGMSGNSEIGEVNVVGNGMKESMDGTFVNDGWTGTSVNPDGNRGDPTHLYSDNGWDAAYDLGDKLTMPVLNDDYHDMITGATVINPASGNNYTHQQYFTQMLSGTTYPGAMTIRANQNFYYNATRPADADPSHRLATDDFILFDAATNRMQINGQITVNGDLTIERGGGNDGTIYYTGRGAILSLNDVNLNTDLLSMNADGTTANSFPVSNIIGIMAANNMAVGSNAQLQLMGAFYAQHTVQSTKQTITIGTLVGSQFDMGTNVPEIYQCPTLASNLPVGMIGAYPILNLAPKSWRELGA